jgi:hypothetical protein
MPVLPNSAKAAQSQLIDNAGYDALGEVQAIPTEYTLLARLKALMDGIAITEVAPPSTGGSGRSVIALTGIKQELAPSSVPMASGVTIMAPSTNSGDISIFRNSADIYGYLMPPAGAPLFYEQDDLAKIRISGNQNDVVHFIWS